MNEAGFIVAVVGLGFLLSFSSVAKHQVSGPISLTCSVISIPVGIALLWRISIEISWWSAAIFVVASLIVGTLNGIFIRRRSIQALFDLQPLLGIGFVLCAGLSWLLR